MKSVFDVFGRDYALLYDDLYRDHNYGDDAQAIITIVSDYLGLCPKKSALDLGCGTGSHAQLLANQFAMVGVDLSEEMLASARRKNPDVVFFHGDARTIKLSRKFDVVLMLSAVLGYQHNNEDILETLRNVRLHLDEHGLLIFDVWHGPTVLLDKPVERIKEFERDGVKMIRKITPTLDSQNNLVTCNYEWWVGDKDDVLTASTETHVMRYYFPKEVKLFARLAGFQVLRNVRAGTAYAMVEPGDWHATYVLQVV